MDTIKIIKDKTLDRVKSMFPNITQSELSLREQLIEKELKSYVNNGLCLKCFTRFLR